MTGSPSLHSGSTASNTAHKPGSPALPWNKCRQPTGRHARRTVAGEPVGPTATIAFSDGPSRLKDCSGVPVVLPRARRTLLTAAQPEWPPPNSVTVPVNASTHQQRVEMTRKPGTFTPHGVRQSGRECGTSPARGRLVPKTIMLKAHSSPKAVRRPACRSTALGDRTLCAQRSAAGH